MNFTSLLRKFSYNNWYISNITLNSWTISVCKKIAKKIGDREVAIAIEIADLFSDDDRDRDRNS